MSDETSGKIVVMFVSQRLAEDAEGYAAAAEAMDALAAEQPGYAGVDSVREPDGLGITLSYWTDEASAIAWRDHPRHAAIRDQGRGRWYAWYTVHVARMTRSYSWTRP